MNKEEFDLEKQKYIEANRDIWSDEDKTIFNEYIKYFGYPNPPIWAVREAKAEVEDLQAIKIIEGYITESMVDYDEYTGSGDYIFDIGKVGYGKVSERLSKIYHRLTKDGSKQHKVRITIEVLD